MRQDLHVHTTWSDGKATPREMIERAIDLGLERIAITDHSYMAADEGYCLPRDTTSYVSEIRTLAREYAGRIDVLCGIEQDYYSPSLTRGGGDAGMDSSDTVAVRRCEFDWVVGSVHYVRFVDTLISVDDTPEIFEQAINAFCDGDPMALAERYFETVAQVVERTGATIIGHFDLVKKFNEKGGYFDESCVRYCAAWRKAADALLETGVPFEINMGGIFRGWRSDPYPSVAIQEYLRSHGALLIETSDAHSAEAVHFACE